MQFLQQWLHSICVHTKSSGLTFKLLLYTPVSHIYALYFAEDHGDWDIFPWTAMHTSLHAHFRFIRNVYKQNNNKNTHDSPKSRNCFIDRGDGENFEKWSMCLGTLAKAEFFVISLTNFIAKYWLTLWRDWTKLKALLLICTAFTSRNTRYVCPQKTSPTEWKPSANQNPRFKVLLQLCPIRHVGGTSLNACYVSLLEAAHSKHVCLEQCLCQPAFQTAQDVRQIQL